MTKQVVIIGGGQAGFSVASTLRKSGFDGDISLVGDEAFPPYQRPPLSKAFLRGELEPERLFFKPPRFFDENRIELCMGVRAIDIDRANRVVQTSKGGLPYDNLVLTTGSSPRRLPDACGGTLGNVHYLRTQGHSQSLGVALDNARHLLVVGGGYVGLEVAAVAAKSGVPVTVVEVGDRILQRVAAPETSDFYRSLHKSHGVDILEGVGIERFEGNSSVTAAVLTDGTRLSADLVVVGIGALPNDELAFRAGLATENGICVDSRGRTSDEAIWAAGDCCSFVAGETRVRLESVQNAVDQGELVARNIAGIDVEYDLKPWFWSDQFDVKLQITGLNLGYDETRVRVLPDGGRSVWYFKKGGFIAVDAMNDPRSYLVGRKLLDMHRNILPDQAENPDFDLRSLLGA